MWYWCLLDSHLRLLARVCKCCKVTRSFLHLSGDSPTMTCVLSVVYGHVRRDFGSRQGVGGARCGVSRTRSERAMWARIQNFSLGYLDLLLARRVLSVQPQFCVDRACVLSLDFRMAVLVLSIKCLQPVHLLPRESVLCGEFLYLVSVPRQRAQRQKREDSS